MGCFYCSASLDSTPWGRQNASNGQTVDHLIPPKRGGLTVSSNLVYACRSCNSEKGEMTLAEYRSWCAAHRTWKLDRWGRFPGER